MKLYLFMWSKSRKTCNCFWKQK